MCIVRTSPKSTLYHPFLCQRLYHIFPPFPDRSVSLNVLHKHFFADLLQLLDTIFPVVLQVTKTDVHPSSSAILASFQENTIYDHPD